MITTADIHKGLTITVDGHDMVVTDMKKEGRSNVVHLKYGKDKTATYTVSELYYAGAKLAGTDSQSVHAPQAKDKISVPRTKGKFAGSVSQVERSGGLHVSVFDKSGKKLYSSWTRDQKSKR